jgi:hypothetical protein
VESPKSRGLEFALVLRNHNLSKEVGQLGERPNRCKMTRDLRSRGREKGILNEKSSKGDNLPMTVIPTL